MKFQLRSVESVTRLQVLCSRAALSHVVLIRNTREERASLSIQKRNNVRFLRLYVSSRASSPIQGPSSTLPAALSQAIFPRMMTELAEWKERYYTTIVPRSAHDAGELGEWSASIRRLQRRKSLPHWAEAELSSLGMLWEVDVVNAKWHANFHVAREFKEAHGGEACDIELSLPFEYENDERADWVEASRWLERQRDLYKRQKLTDLKVKLLKSVLGVRLNRPYGKKRRNVHPALVAANREFQEDLERRRRVIQGKEVQ